MIPATLTQMGMLAVNPRLAIFAGPSRSRSGMGGWSYACTHSLHGLSHTFGR